MSGGMWIYGPLPPEPNGGVAVFMERLIRGTGVRVEGVVDPYFGKKIRIAPAHVTPAKPGLIQRFKVTSTLLTLRAKPLLINASTPRGVMFVSPFLVRRSAPTALLLHHGDLGNSAEMSPARRRFLRLLIGRFDRIGCLSERQMAFYTRLDIDGSKLRLVDIYLPPNGAEGRLPSPLMLRVLEWIGTNELPLVIASGSAKELYRHDWILDALEKRNGHEFRYLLCCYGEATPYLPLLEKRFQAAPNAFLAFGLDSSEFDRVLELGDVYARPTDIESFGIAAWDAAAKGLQIVASDACDRPAGYIHRVGCKTDFFQKLNSALDNAQRGESAPASRAQEARVHVITFLNGALLTDEGPYS